MIPQHIPISLDIPSDYYSETDYPVQVQGRTNIYLSKTKDLELSFREEQLIKKTLDNLTPKDKQGNSIPISRLRNDRCREILEKLHSQIGLECHTKLNLVGLEAVSEWSMHSNLKAKDKLCALQEFLDKPVVWTTFSTVKLKSICSKLEEAIKTKQGNGNESNEIKVRLGADVLTIKQTYLHGEPQNTIQYKDHTPCPIDNCSWKQLKHLLLSTINSMQTDRAAKNYRRDPPIRKLDYSEVYRTVNIIRENMEGWDVAVATEEATKADHGKNNERIIQEQWNTKLEETRHILDLVVRGNPNKENREYYVYEVNNTPVGMMVLSTATDALYIYELVAHPGSQGAGGSLIEFAVNQSVILGRKGKLSLEPIENSIKSYEAMGFKLSRSLWRHPMWGSMEKLSMALDPANNSKWLNEGGKWKLESHAHKDRQYTWTAFDGDDTSLSSAAIRG